MKTFNVFLITLITLLSLAAGIAKVMQVPEEVAFLNGFGFSTMLIIVYGVAQIAGAVLFAFPDTFRIGALIVTLAFVLSAGLIFSSGNIVFGFVSLLPIAVTCLAVWLSGRMVPSDP